MKIRDLENALKYRRIPYPKRSVELIALIAISSTFFLFMHTKSLNTRLREMEVKLQPSEFSALELSGENHVNGGISAKHSENINSLHGTYQYLKSTGQNLKIGQNLRNMRKKPEQSITPEINDGNANNGNKGLSMINNTENAQVDVLFFNRVPKVGSQALMELMNRLGKINNFETRRDKGKTYETVLLPPRDQRALALELLSFHKPVAFSKHIAFVNFTRFDFPKPIYVNLVRDPIERVISWHYYIRAPWYYKHLKKKLGDKAMQKPDEEFMKMDLDTCIRTQNKHCQFIQNEITNPVGDHRRQTLFFCGQNKLHCLPFNSEKTLQKAKLTVETEYAVVGTWEDTNITLTVLEHYIPKFFKNAKIAFHLDKDILSKINKNSYKREISSDVEKILRKNFTREIEFYEFCKQRLYQQYAALNLERKIDNDDYMLLPEIDENSNAKDDY